MADFGNAAADEISRQIKEAAVQAAAKQRTEEMTKAMGKLPQATGGLEAADPATAAGGVESPGATFR